MSIPVVNLYFRISPRIFGKIRNGPFGTLKGSGETDSWKKPEVENLVSESLYTERLVVEDQDQEGNGSKDIFLIWKTVHTFSHALKKHTGVNGDWRQHYSMNVWYSYKFLDTFCLAYSHRRIHRYFSRFSLNTSLNHICSPSLQCWRGWRMRWLWWRFYWPHCWWRGGGGVDGLEYTGRWGVESGWREG